LYGWSSKEVGVDRANLDAVLAGDVFGFVRIHRRTEKSHSTWTATVGQHPV